jgi:hypothetical protein
LIAADRSCFVDASAASAEPEDHGRRAGQG